jgi:hypothetical protein
MSDVKTEIKTKAMADKKPATCWIDAGTQTSGFLPYGPVETRKQSIFDGISPMRKALRERIAGAGTGNRPQNSAGDM